MNLEMVLMLEELFNSAIVVDGVWYVRFEECLSSLIGVVIAYGLFMGVSCYLAYQFIDLLWTIISFLRRKLKKKPTVE